MVHILIVVATLLAAQQPPVAVDQSSWPSAGVFDSRDVDTRPEVISRVQPVYTEQGIRRRLQGFVTIEIIVEPDGTVGPTRIIASLDAEAGMDDAAVTSVKQWRFKPATRGGVPVRALAKVMVTFSLKGVPPPIRLPAGFDVSTDDPAGWSRSEVTAGGVRLELGYPDSWQMRSQPGLAVMVAAPKGHLSLGIYPPMSVPRPIPYPLPVAELVRYSETMRIQFAKANGAQLIGVGQAPLGGANWLWLELDLGDQARVWAFTTSVGTRLVSVACTLVTPTLRMTPEERDAEIVAARSPCANLIRRLSISSTES